MYGVTRSIFPMKTFRSPFISPMLMNESGYRVPGFAVLYRNETEKLFQMMNAWSDVRGKPWDASALISIVGNRGMRSF